MFQLKTRDGLGRIGTLETGHGAISTPTILPVVNPHYMPIHPLEMRNIGAEAIITNAYIIYHDKELCEQALQLGLHTLLNFDGPIMTDSGTFQSYVYGDVDVEPLEIVEFQKKIGSDIGTILDVFGTPDQTFKEAEESIKETLKRAKKVLK